MELLVLVLLTLLFAALACASVCFLIKQPLNVAAGLVGLCVLFYLFPALAWMHGLEAGFEYGFATVGAGVRLDGNLADLALVMGLTAMLLLGGLWSMWLARGSARIAPQTLVPDGALTSGGHPSFASERLLLLAAVWLGLVLLIRNRSGLSLVELMLPARKVKADVYGSFYVLYLVVYVPLAIGAVLCLRAGRLRVMPAACFLLSFLVALGASQRRNILIVVLFVVALCSTRWYGARTRTRRTSDGGRSKPVRSLIPRRVTMACLGTLCLALGPALWWVRNWFTGALDPGQEMVVPWERRGFLELFFGSAGAGFPMFLLVKEWVAADGVQWGVSLLATVSVAIPRALWPDKPHGAEDLLQQRFGLVTTPSTFLINELYLNAGVLALPLALFVGRALSGIYHRCVAIGSPRSRIVIAAMFANLITLFKNGLGIFAVNVVFIVVLCWWATIPARQTPIQMRTRSRLREGRTQTSWSPN